MNGPGRRKAFCGEFSSSESEWLCGYARWFWLSSSLEFNEVESHDHDILLKPTESLPTHAHKASSPNAFADVSRKSESLRGRVMARRKIGYEEFRQESILNKQNKTSTHVILYSVLSTLAFFFSFIPPANMCPQCQSGAKELPRTGDTSARAHKKSGSRSILTHIFARS